MTVTDTAKPDDPEKNAKQLRVLVFLHYVVAVFTAILAIRGIPLVVLGWPMMKAQGPVTAASPEWFAPVLEALADAFEAPEFKEEPALVGMILFMTGAVIIVLSVVHAVAIAYVGRLIAQRRRRTLILVFSWFDLMWIPPGTIISIITIILLKRPSVRAEFEQATQDAKR